MTSLNSNSHQSKGNSALGLFLRRWLANPTKIGAVAPSAPALTRRMARETHVADDSAVIELGAGTGAVTRALLAGGVPKERLLLVERDGDLAQFLRESFPGVTVIKGDAAELVQLLPECWRGRVSTVVSSLPLMSFPKAVRHAIAEAAFGVLSPGGRFVQYTYGPFSPLPAAALGLEGRRVGFAGVNLPPATVWRYTRVAKAAA
jgi:phosphatidylethanolamine/phosphatidyl-N-methylethanolamine N-methyltransferase